MMRSGDRLHLLDVFEQTFEQRARQIPLAGIRQHHHDRLAGLRGLARQAQRRGHRGAARDAAQDALLARQTARHGDGLFVADLLDAIDQRRDPGSSG